MYVVFERIAVVTLAEVLSMTKNEYDKSADLDDAAAATVNMVTVQARCLCFPSEISAARMSLILSFAWLFSDGPFVADKK